METPQVTAVDDVEDSTVGLDLSGWNRDELEAEVRRLREKLKRVQKEKREAREADRSKSEFLAWLSHEIRTPLNSVLGSSSMMMELSPGEDQRDLLGIVDSAGRALLDLLNDVLDLSKIESGRVELEYSGFDPRECVEEVVECLEYRAEANEVELKVTFADDLPGKVWADRMRTRQVLTNLLGNAIKFTAKGRVEVRLYAKAIMSLPRRVRRRMEKSIEEEDYRSAIPLRLYFEVADTGIGISGEELPKLFRPYSQAHGALSRDRGGSGLGLAISKKLSELMGGELTVESEEGKGSRFTFSLCGLALPVVLEKGGGGAEELPASGPDFAKHFPMRVMVADDVPHNLEVTVRMLEFLGYEPDRARDGREVLERARQCNYDLILMDLRMPFIDGIEATREFRKEEKRARENGGGPSRNGDSNGCGRTRIVAMTAEATSYDRARCLEAGMNDYLRKPVKFTELVSKLREHAQV